MSERLFITDYIGYANERLEKLLSDEKIEPKLREAMWYSVSAGGKRVRPVLNMLANRLFDGDIDETMDMACAIEMIHTYSLIHDDLPALDNDNLRRGKPTNHIVHGEAFAILAGDGLLNMAFEVMLANAVKYPSNAQKHLKAMSYIASAVGVTGMISGQCADIMYEDVDEKDIDIEVVGKIHANKTGKLITASLMSGALLTDATEDELKTVEKFGKKIGLAFQVADDILDVVGDEKKLGKSAGKDAEAGKVTYPHVYGLENSIKIADDLIAEAKDCMSIFGKKSNDLVLLAEYFVKRIN
jgi:geranylgeranyl diphosphate synthase, type II